MNQYLAKLGALEWRIVLSIAILAVAGYWFLSADDNAKFEEQIKAATTEKKLTEKKLKDIQVAASDAKRFEEENKSITAQRDALSNYLPASLGVTDLIQIINREATAAGLEIVKTTDPKLSERIEFYETLKLDVQLSGTYGQIVLFLSSLTKLNQLVTVDRISIDTSVKSTLDVPRLDFKGTVIGYRYLKEVANKSTDSAKKDDAAGAANAK